MATQDWSKYDRNAVELCYVGGIAVFESELRDWRRGFGRDWRCTVTSLIDFALLSKPTVPGITLIFWRPEGFGGRTPPAEPLELCLDDILTGEETIRVPSLNVDDQLFVSRVVSALPRDERLWLRRLKKEDHPSVATFSFCINLKAFRLPAAPHSPASSAS